MARRTGCGDDPRRQLPNGTTMRSRSRLVATTLVAISSLLLTACGGNATPSTTDPATAPDSTVDVEPATATDPEPAPAADPDLDCSAQGADLAPRPVDGMPAEVAALRDLLLDAALRCDEQLLFTATEESDEFTVSFGDGTDPIGYWWDLEAAGEAPFLRLAQVLSTTPALSAGGDVWVWPQVTTGRSEHTAEAAWAELVWLEDPAAMRAAGDGYLDWRVGISVDGQWRFFVAGD
ncbi:hypothetical protein [Nitriliruptor alkaliphilus]|uniref:hypothetical protein n=1 Tax=Nitriliruptor alkaliphilus TaxID=427918 RepID=UPI001B802F7C|nr:hypothetical protein [Nitriliruptor alkaliphilus]